MFNKKQQEENGKKLRARLQKTVDAGPPKDKNDLFGQLSFNFSRNLLNDLNNIRVKK